MPAWFRALIQWFRPGYLGGDIDPPPAPPSPPVLRIEAPEGEAVCEVRRASNGLYRFEEWTMGFDEEVDGPYLSPTFESGLYATAADAERDARLTLPWLRDATPPTPSRVDAPRGAA